MDIIRSYFDFIRKIEITIGFRMSIAILKFYVVKSVRSNTVFSDLSP